MLKNITLSAEEHLIKQAREKAREEQTSLNIRFREWLCQYAQTGRNKADAYDNYMKNVKHADAGRSFSREEMNER